MNFYDEETKAFMEKAGWVYEEAHKCFNIKRSTWGMSIYDCHTLSAYDPDTSFSIQIPYMKSFDAALHTANSVLEGFTETELLKCREERIDSFIEDFEEEIEDEILACKDEFIIPPKLIEQARKYGYHFAKVFATTAYVHMAIEFERVDTVRIILRHWERKKRCSVVLKADKCLYFMEVTKDFGFKKIEGNFCPEEICYFANLFFNHDE